MRIEWNGNVENAGDVPEGLTKDTKIRVWGPTEGDVEVAIAGDLDWRHWKNIDSREQGFLQLFGISGEQDVIAYEVIE